MSKNNAPDERLGLDMAAQRRLNEAREKCPLEKVGTVPHGPTTSLRKGGGFKTEGRARQR
jgi:hypothetical protein